MYRSYPELLAAAMECVKMCRVEKNEKVVVYTDSEMNAAIFEAFYSACVAIGCDVVLIRALGRKALQDPPETAIEAMKNADMVFDIASRSWSDYAPASTAICDTGTRVLQILVPEETLIERPPHPDILRRPGIAAELMEGVEEVRITTPEGTDLRAKRGHRPLDLARGFVCEPGKWDSYGVISLAYSPIEEDVHGVMYMNGPMLMQPEHVYVAKEPIKVEIEAGRIVDIEATHGDARIFDNWMRSFDDPNVYYISHLGFGLDPRATVDDSDPAALESINGAIVLGFGSNVSPFLGGTRHAKGHMDCVLMNGAMMLDGRTILADGRFAEDTGLAG